MSKTVISNDFLSVTIDSKGAEVISVNKAGKELLWDGNPDFWTGHAPVLFPICGGLKDDKFIFENKEYHLPKHGFAKISQFELEYADKTKAVFLLSSDEESLKKYPFSYEFRIIYTLDGTTLNVEYNTKNLSDNDMYYSVGAHEAYACPGGIENYSILFDCEEILRSVSLEGPLLTKDKFLVQENTKELKLSKELFKVDSLIFDDLKSRKVWLENINTKEKIEICFEGFDYLLLWTIPDAQYICIEPWCGIPDYVTSDYDITDKPGIIKVGKNEISVKNHTIRF